MQTSDDPLASGLLPSDAITRDVVRDVRSLFLADAASEIDKLDSPLKVVCDRLDLDSQRSGSGPGKEGEERGGEMKRRDERFHKCRSGDLDQSQPTCGRLRKGLRRPPWQATEPRHPSRAVNRQDEMKEEEEGGMEGWRKSRAEGRRRMKRS